MPYIYKITNLKNQKIYIGQTSSSIDERWKQHIRDSRKEECKTRPLYRAFNKYGIENFLIEEVEQCNFDEVNEREIFWIEFYNSYKYGYNATFGGEGRPLADYNLIYNLWNDGKSRTEIVKLTNYDIHTVNRALSGFNIEKEKLYQRGIASYSNKIARLDKDTLQVLQVYPSIAEAERQFNIPRGRSHISKVCRGTRSSTLGYKWKFI